MMTKIDSGGQLAEFMRRQLLSMRRPAGRQHISEAVKASTSIRASGDLATALARRVAAIPENDPQRERKAFHIFLESSLLAEFGPDMACDTSFPRIVEQVESQMLADAELAVSIREAAQALLDMASKDGVG